MIAALESAGLSQLDLFQAVSRDGGDQNARYKPLEGFGKWIRSVQLHKLALVHHRHHITHEFDHTEIMADEDVGEPVPA